MRRSLRNRPTLITSAPESNDDEYDRRRRRYAIMMSLRALCVVGAAATYRVSFILAMAFVVGGVVLPWCAVLIANDRPPKRRASRVGHDARSIERALPGESDRTVDG